MTRIVYHNRNPLLSNACFLQQQPSQQAPTAKQWQNTAANGTMRIIVLSLILYVLSYYPDSIWFMDSPNSDLWHELSTSSQTDNAISTSNNTLRSGDWYHNEARRFNYSLESKWNCHKTMEPTRFNKYDIYVYIKEKTINYGTEKRYKSATKDSVWLTQSNQTHTKTFMSFFSSNITHFNDNPNNSVSHNSNMKDVINNNDHVIYAHVDHFPSNDHKKIIKGRYTNATKFKSNDNISNNIQVKIDCIYDSERQPSIHSMIILKNHNVTT